MEKYKIKKSYSDALSELDNLCVCGSTKPFNNCCGKL